MGEADVFDYIEMFYNMKPRHGSSNALSSAEFEKQYFQRLGNVQKTRGDSHCATTAVSTSRPNSSGRLLLGRYSSGTRHLRNTWRFSLRCRA
jgi:hypothetical protein